jgi:rhamnulose-1-phosphate aldolase/alcohol dehydrogenase
LTDNDRNVKNVSPDQESFTVFMNALISPTAFEVPDCDWNSDIADRLEGPGQLLYRSNLLGCNPTITNFGGGNTSAKLDAIDPLSQGKTEILWVKGSGGDLGTMGRDGFATLYQDKLLMLEKLYPGLDREDDMVALLNHCIFNVNPRAPSIDTPLHAYLPYTHVDHLHPDSVIAIAACDRGEELVHMIFGGRVGWLPWQRPGFDLGLKLRDYVQAHPDLDGIILGGHGLFSWGDSSEACYRNSIDLIAKAARYLNDARAGRPVFGGAQADIPKAGDAMPDTLLQRLRRAVSADGLLKIAHIERSAVVMEFVSSRDLGKLAALGTSCPDHFLRTKIAPLVLAHDLDDIALNNAVQGYRERYAQYYDRCKRPDSPAMRDANPVVLLVPGFGMITFANDKATARLASEFYVNAINVMRGATLLGEYVALPEQDAFDIEYWLLEEAKLKRMPPPRPLTGRIAYVTGAAGGIGSACAEALLDAGAVVMLVDQADDALAACHANLVERHGADAVRYYVADVTDEAAVIESVAQTVRAYGGLDILVANAGIASSAAIEDTSLEMWRENYGVLVEGYFLAARSAFSLMKGLGGSIIFVGSKNGLAAAANASAYSSAKAAELHLARCLALEGAKEGIRVNSVNPDAVLRGSRIWQGDWRTERAKTHQVSEEALEDVYRERSLLKRSVFPEDVARAVLFFASDTSAKSTGNILNVDAGNAAAFTR